MSKVQVLIRLVQWNRADAIANEAAAVGPAKRKAEQHREQAAHALEREFGKEWYEKATAALLE